MCVYRIETKSFIEKVYDIPCFCPVIDEELNFDFPDSSFPQKSENKKTKNEKEDILKESVRNEEAFLPKISISFSAFKGFY